MFMKLKSSMLVFLSSSLFALVAQAYNPPIGIPDPSDRWGTINPIDDPVPARPASWTSEIAGYYYIDPGHPSASDSNNFGHPAAPRVSLPGTPAPGAYVEMHGTYVDQVNIADWNCTEAKPCWIVGLENDRPILRERFRISYSSYVFIDGLESTNGSGSAFRFVFGGHHVAFRNNYIHDRPHPGSGGHSGIGVGNANAGEKMHDIIMYNNRFERLGNVASEVDQDFHGMTIVSDGDYVGGTIVHHVWSLDNYCEEASGDCVQINGNNGENSHLSLHHIYVGRNESLNNRQTNTGVKQASDVIVSQNKCRGSFPLGGNKGGCYGHQYEKDWVWFIFNESSNAVHGHRHSSNKPRFDELGNIDPSFVQRVFEIGNLVYDIKPNPAGKWVDPEYRDNPAKDGTAFQLEQGKGLTAYVVDNTVYNAYTCMANRQDTIETHITGNICAEVKEDNDNQLQLAIGARDQGIHLDYNWFIDDIENEFAVQYPGIDNVVYDFVQWQTLSPKECSNCIASIAPAYNYFVNASTDPRTRDFRLVEGAPGVGTNRKSPVYDMFFQRYGIDIYVDFNGNPRHPTNPSMGAFEHTGNIVLPDPPQPPENFSVIKVIEN